MQSSHFTLLKITQDVYNRAGNGKTILVSIQNFSQKNIIPNSLALLLTFCIVELEKQSLTNKSYKHTMFITFY